MWMLAPGMFVNPDGLPFGSILFGIGVLGVIVGFAWLGRIAKFRDDSDRSFFRYRRRR
jgi:hypothetical protein